MKVAIISDTPFQVFGALILKKEKFVDKEVDLFIVNQFTTAKELFTRIQELQIFRSVYLVDYKSEKKFYYLLTKIYEICLPKYLIKKWIPKIDYKYDILCITNFNRLQITLRLLNSKSRLLFYDDGIGSYFGNVYTASFKKHRKFYRLMKKESIELNPELIYLFNPFFVINKQMGIKVKGMCENAEHILKNTIKEISPVFDLYGEIDQKYVEKKMIFLSQPNDLNSKDFFIKMKLILTTLEKYKENLLVRPHPRENFKNKTDFTIDLTNILWELIINKIDISEKILIGNFSTAMITPKILFDKEPTLIFLYKIFDIKNQDYYDEIVEKIKMKYSNGDKILIPQNMEELKWILNNFTLSRKDSKK